MSISTFFNNAAELLSEEPNAKFSDVILTLILVYVLFVAIGLAIEIGKVIPITSIKKSYF